MNKQKQYIEASAPSIDSLYTESSNLKHKQISSPPVRSRRVLIVTLVLLGVIIGASVLAIYWYPNSQFATGKSPDESDYDIDTGTVAELALDSSETDIAADQTRILKSGFYVFDTLTIKGKLRCPYIAGANITITANKILVRGGKFHCTEGTNIKKPFTGRLTIILKGDKPIIEATDDGQIIMRGRDSKLSWSRLSATGFKGNNSIVVPRQAKWAPGDEIVIAPTDFKFDAYEVFRIEQASQPKNAPDILRLRLNDTLKYTHFGQDQVYGGKTLYNRAEVALLTRSIRIIGDETDFGRFKTGVSISLMGKGKLRLDNVEIRNAGHYNVIMRYPIHFHHLGDGSGNFVSNTSIFRSWNRCVSIHCTNKVILDSNSCIDHAGHGFYLEGGPEEDNILIRNLGMATRTGASLNPSDIPGELVRGAGPSTFWTANPNNQFIENVAAGSQWLGFSLEVHSDMYAFQKSQKTCNRQLKPLDEYRHMPFQKFESNIAHSTGSSGFWISEWYSPQPNTVLKSIQAYKIGGKGRFPSCFYSSSFNVHIDDSICADFSRALWLVFENTFSNSVLVAASDNLGDPETNLEKQVGRTLPGQGRSTGQHVYDGPTVLINVHFANFNYPQNSGILTCHVDMFNGASTSNKNYMNGITFSNPSTLTLCKNQAPSAIWNPDGSMTGIKNAFVMHKFSDDDRTRLNPGPLFSNVDCSAWPDENADTIVCRDFPEHAEIRLGPKDKDQNTINLESTLTLTEIDSTPKREEVMKMIPIHNYYKNFVKSKTFYKVTYDKNLPSGGFFILQLRSAVLNDFYYLIFDNGMKFNPSKSMFLAASESVKSITEVKECKASCFFVDQQNDLVYLAIRTDLPMGNIDENGKSMNYAGQYRNFYFN